MSETKMASKIADTSSEPKMPLEVLMEMGHGPLISKIRQLKEEIEADRVLQIKEKLDKSGKKLRSHINQLLSATGTDSSLANNSSEASQLGAGSALCVMNGFSSGSEDKEFTYLHEAVFPKSIELPKMQRIPRYTTWIFLDRNQRMAEDQSVVGRRRIYYDQSGNEALICSDSEDDMTEIEEEKREFAEGEDRILWMAFQENGCNENVADVVSHFVGGTSSEILDRYNELKLKFEASHSQGSSGTNINLEKSLSATLDSLDNLFCRRCLVFDCHLHGCSQSLVYPSEKHSSSPEPEDGKPCSRQCYILIGQASGNLDDGNLDEGSDVHGMEDVIFRGQKKGSSVHRSKQNVGCNDVGSVCSLGFHAGEGSARRVVYGGPLPAERHAVVGKRKKLDGNAKEFESKDSSGNPFGRRQTKIQVVEAVTAASESDSASAISFANAKTNKRNLEVHEKVHSHLTEQNARTSNDRSLWGTSSSPTTDIVRDGVLDIDEVSDIDRRLELEQPTALEERGEFSSISKWKPLEKDLYAKGLEIFGRNSCLIARNLLSGFKTCADVFSYMHNNGALMTYKKDTSHCSEDCATTDPDSMEQERLRQRSRIFRKRGRTRRLKYSSKSNGHPSSWKRTGDADQSCKQYTPCTCLFMCGKDCPCLLNGTCCEKYCGCSKSCKNRFRGCHCAKSQCRSRQCPCFAANRECDPDVCRNCWVSCGGGSLGEPTKKGDGQCGNMRLLLRQQQRVLLGRSDVAGWGAFIKNSVNKHEYLGEYTGELISHREADKRGKIYDRANSSFLFDLNDQYVLDACRHGDKLKFANHSSKPNCYCKVMLVAGDHRVGIFAKERIEAKEELFYDYRYGPDQAPAWARKPEASKKDDPLASEGRARKHQSR